MSPIELIGEFFDMLRRRFWLVAAIVVLGAALSVLLALSMPRVYEATEVIQIEQPVVSGDIAPGLSANASARHLQLIQQRLLTRPTILEISQAFGLFDDKPGLTVTEQVNQIRAAVRIEGIAAAREGYSDDGTISVLSITARMDTAETARVVAHEFARRTLELSASQRLEDAQQTLDFFTLQEQTLKQEIATIEDARESFRATSTLAIPGAIDFQRSELSSINASLLDLDQRLIAARGEIARLSAATRISAVEQRRIDEARAELEALDQQREGLVARRGEIENAISRVPDAERALSDFDNELEQLQGELQVVAGHRRQAETNHALEARNQGGRLSVIEPAVAPDYPVSRSRKTVALMGAVASVAFAIGLAFVLDLLHPVIRSAAQMERQVGLRPVVSIPSLQGDRRRGLFRRRPRPADEATPPRT